jgi:hypothetical protein
VESISAFTPDKTKVDKVTQIIAEVVDKDNKLREVIKSNNLQSPV